VLLSQKRANEVSDRFTGKVRLPTTRPSLGEKPPGRVVPGDACKRCFGEYFRLARFLQPATMVIEDVDLIAREREQMHNPGQEILLNKLLNEMDGLREDADVIFILTTNRPDHLEPALASRPGRIDQAIEFPLPDEEGRRKLVQLYSGGLEVSPPIMDLLVRRTERATPAFIKELMRRAAQLQIGLGTDSLLDQSAVDGAIEEMLFTGGTLNLKLLGGPAAQPIPNTDVR